MGIASVQEISAGKVLQLRPVSTEADGVDGWCTGFASQGAQALLGAGALARRIIMQGRQTGVGFNGR